MNQFFENEVIKVIIISFPLEILLIILLSFIKELKIKYKIVIGSCAFIILIMLSFIYSKIQDYKTEETGSFKTEETTPIPTYTVTPIPTITSTPTIIPAITEEPVPTKNILKEKPTPKSTPTMTPKPTPTMTPKPTPTPTMELSQYSIAEDEDDAIIQIIGKNTHFSEETIVTVKYVYAEDNLATNYSIINNNLIEIYFVGRWKDAEGLNWEAAHGEYIVQIITGNEIVSSNFIYE